MTVKDEIGAHVSFDRRHPGETFREAAEIGANSIQIFTKPPRKLFAEPFPKPVIDRWKAAWKKSNIKSKNVFVHAGYLINLAKKGPNTKALIDEAKLCQQLGIKYLVVHPGSNTIGDMKLAINNIAHNITKCLEKVPGVTILLETMYRGKIGATFDEIGAIIKKVRVKYGKGAKIGVVMDTAHLHIAGYFLHTELLIRKLVARFKNAVGIRYLKAIHINNTLMRVGSKQDQHVGINIGRIPYKSLSAIVTQHLIKRVPYILETHANYKAEIKMLRSQ